MQRLIRELKARRKGAQFGIRVENFERLVCSGNINGHQLQTKQQGVQESIQCAESRILVRVPLEEHETQSAVR